MQNIEVIELVYYVSKLTIKCQKVNKSKGSYVKSPDWLKIY